MAILKNWDGSSWVDALPPVRENRIYAGNWEYSAYLPSRLHTSSDRSFILQPNRVSRNLIVGLTFVRLDIWARIGRLGSNAVTFGSATSDHIVTAPWSDTQFVRHFGFTEVPSTGSITVTTNYPMPTTPPSLYIFAVGIWN